MKTAFFLLGTLLLANIANASVEAVKAGNSTQIANATEYTLTVTGKEPSTKQVAEEVAKRIRHEIHKDGGTIDTWDLKRVSLSKAFENLSKEDGDFKGTTERDSERLTSWIEDKKVRETVYKMSLLSNYFGADGSSVVYIFVPTELYNPVLTISYMQYGEE